MNIFVVAGPPGIGKSTNAREIIPKGIEIIDQDLAGYQYKKQGFDSYQDLATLSTREQIKRHLFSKVSFALELNLGFQSHYDFLKSILAFDPKNKAHLILFYTDDLNLCITRARIRHQNGGHEVKQEIIEEMYHYTFPLLFQNLSLFESVRLMDVTHLAFHEYTRADLQLPNWITENGLKEFLT